MNQRLVSLTLDLAARAEAVLPTILPCLFFLRSAFVKPPTVFTFFPLKTAARFPTLLTFMAFIFIEAIFIDDIFMVFFIDIVFIFIAIAIGGESCENQRKLLTVFGDGCVEHLRRPITPTHWYGFSPNQRFPREDRYPRSSRLPQTSDST